MNYTQKIFIALLCCASMSMHGGAGDGYEVTTTKQRTNYESGSFKNVKVDQRVKMFQETDLVPVNPSALIYSKGKRPNPTRKHKPGASSAPLDEADYAEAAAAGLANDDDVPCADIVDALTPTSPKHSSGNSSRSEDPEAVKATLQKRAVELTDASNADTNAAVLALKNAFGGASSAATPATIDATAAPVDSSALATALAATVVATSGSSDSLFDAGKAAVASLSQNDINMQVEDLEHHIITRHGAAKTALDNIAREKAALAKAQTAFVATRTKHNAAEAIAMHKYDNIMAQLKKQMDAAAAELKAVQDAKTTAIKIDETTCNEIQTRLEAEKITFETQKSKIPGQQQELQKVAQLIKQKDEQVSATFKAFIQSAQETGDSKAITDAKARLHTTDKRIEIKDARRKAKRLMRYFPPSKTDGYQDVAPFDCPKELESSDDESTKPAAAPASGWRLW